MSSSLLALACITNANCTQCQGPGGATEAQTGPWRVTEYVQQRTAPPLTITEPWWARSPELGSGAFWPLTEPQTQVDIRTPRPHRGLEQVTRKMGDRVHFFFFFGIKRPEVERNVPWMCPPRQPPSPQARYPRRLTLHGLPEGMKTLHTRDQE